MKTIWLVLGFSLAFTFFVKAQTNPAFERGMFINKTDTLPYRILMPLNFDPAKKYPLIIFLHGVGERGNDNEKQLVHGGALFLKDSIRQQFPAIVVFPQCPVKSYWANVNIVIDTLNKKYTFNFQEGGKATTAMASLIALMENLRQKPYVNKYRVYVAGLSMGGMGTFEILRRKPKYFAAAIAICGGDNTNNAKKYATKAPLWIFHGGKDDTVTPDHSIIMVQAIKAAGGDPKFTLYPNDKHNSWDDTFAEPELLPWLFGHKK